MRLVTVPSHNTYVQLSGHLSDVICADTLNVCVINGNLIMI